jgi:hypothetical protein
MAALSAPRFRGHHGCKYKAGAFGRERRLPAMAEEMRPEAAFGLQGANENIWHIARAERWSDGGLIGHRTFCGRNYPADVEQRDLEGLDQVCSDCTAQVSQNH